MSRISFYGHVTAVIVGLMVTSFILLRRDYCHRRFLLLHILFYGYV